MRPVAVVGFAGQVLSGRDGRNDAEILAPVVEEALSSSGLSGEEIGVVVTASSEFLNGVVGGVMGAFDALPCWPPRTHAHNESDGAWAFYEAWVRVRAGEADAALACAFSRPLGQDPRAVLRLQHDPYLIGPLGAGPLQMAALQARALLDSGRYGEDDLAAVALARRPDRAADPEAPYVAPPLRETDCSRVCPGAVAVVLAAGETVKRAARPAWIAGVDHRIETGYPGARDLAASPSIHLLSERLGVAGSELDVLELHAPFTHQELIALDALAAARVTSLNPSGGALAADPIMATGLLRIGHAAKAVMDGRAGRVAAHATNGPCLQHNLLCVLRAEP